MYVYMYVRLRRRDEYVCVCVFARGISYQLMNERYGLNGCYAEDGGRSNYSFIEQFIILYCVHYCF